MIFVFGSNLAGRHGKGAALEAVKNFGAIYGQGAGLQGNSYAIPTKDKYIKTLPLTEIQKYVDVFLMFADNRKDLIFQLTPIGCGLAGYKYEDIAPMFLKHSMNVLLPKEFRDVLHKQYGKEYFKTMISNSIDKYPVINEYLQNH